MERYLLIGNGINIQFGGLDSYSGAAIMNRVVDNINSGRYTVLTEYELSTSQQIELLQKLVKVIDQIKAGKHRNKCDGLLMWWELERIGRTYPDKNSISSVFLEDYFLAFEIFNNGFKDKEGEKQSETHRKIMFTFLHQIIVDGIYNEGAVNEVYKEFYPGMRAYLNKFSNIFTTNYDYNLENLLESSERVCHLHGEFGKLAPEYDTQSQYYMANKTECDCLIAKKVPGMDHIYSDAIMSWSWLDKYGELIEIGTKYKEEQFKSISGQLEIVGLAPANDEHLFVLINNNPNIKSVVYYYLKDEDRIELLNHIKKPVTFKKVEKLWSSMK